jgi:hypothetical protein
MEVPVTAATLPLVPPPGPGGVVAAAALDASPRRAVRLRATAPVGPYHRRRPSILLVTSSMIAIAFLFVLFGT